jgi:hypothetical protein
MKKIKNTLQRSKLRFVSRQVKNFRFNKIIFSFLSFLLLFTSFASYFTPPALAQDSESTWYSPNVVDWYTKVYDEDISGPTEIFGERYTAAQVQWILYSLFSFPLNVMAQGNTDAVACVLSLGFDSSVDLANCAQGFIEMIQKTTDKFKIVDANTEKSFLATVFDTSDRSFSGINYVKDRASNFSVVPGVRAQEGYGYSQFGIIRDSYWKAALNAAYFLSVLVIIIFAFMIMFRVKISPQVVISVQSALPKVIFAIILATFSYAIAGFIVDLMYVISGLLASLLNMTGIASSFSRAYNVIVGNPLGFTTTVFGGPITILLYMLLYVVLFFVSVIWNFLASFLFSLSLITGGALGIVGLLVTVWLIVLMLWYMIKIPWVLIKTTINIYLAIIIAPLQILFGAFSPNGGFSAWLKNMFANVMVFPLTGVMMYLAYDFLMFSYTAGSDVGFGPVIQKVCDLIGKASCIAGGTMWSPPLLGEDITGFIMLFISFGVIVAIPKASDILKSIIMGEKFAFGSAIGEAVAPLQKVWGSTGAPIVGSYQQAIGRERVASFQERIRPLVRGNQRIPGWLKKVLLADPGKE